MLDAENLSMTIALRSAKPRRDPQRCAPVGDRFERNVSGGPSPYRDLTANLSPDDAAVPDLL